jgi:hypothetical protein
MAFIPVQTGNFPDDPNADTIRTAFNIVNLNFTELYGNLSNIASNVNSITAGTGISVNGSVGNVTVTSLFSSLSTHSDTLTVTGIGGAVPPGGVVDSDYTVDRATDTLILELNPAANVTFNNIAASANLTVGGNVTVSTGNVTLGTGNLIVTSGTISGNILSANANAVQFGDASGIVTSDTRFTYNSSNTTLTITGGNLNTQNVSAGYSISGTVLSIGTDATIYGAVAAGSVNSLGNYTGSGNLSITGNATVANITSLNIDATGTVAADYLAGDGSNITNINASNITTGTLSSAVLSGSYAIDITGNSATSVTVTGSAQANITSLGTLTGLAVSGNITANNVSIARELSGNSANYTGPVTVDSLAANFAIGGTSGLFTGQMTVGTLYANGAATVESLTSNTSVIGTVASFSGNVSAANLISTNVTASANISALDISASNNISAVSYTGTSSDLTGSANSISINTNQATVLGNVLAGNVYANSGNIRTQTLTVTGALAGVNGVYSGNVNSGNVVATQLIAGANITATTNVTANTITANISLSAATITGTAANITTVESNTVVVADTITASAVKFTGLTTDPAGTPGLMYYNSTTNQLRLYNGTQWQNLN